MSNGFRDQTSRIKNLLDGFDSQGKGGPRGSFFCQKQVMVDFQQVLTSRGKNAKHSVTDVTRIADLGLKIRNLLKRQAKGMRDC